MQRPGSALSKLKKQQQVLNVSTTHKPVEKKVYTTDGFIKNRDFEGAITLLEHEKLLNRDNIQNRLWLAYSYFHSGDFPSALSIYTELTKKQNYDLEIHNYMACCYYALCKYKEGFEEAKKGKESPLNTRIKFHLAFKLGLGQEVIDAHSKLTSSPEDNLTLAALHYLKNEHDDAIEIYKKMYMDKKYDALDIYLAMCYYKSEYYDIALDLVNHYLGVHPDSITASNLKACIEYSSTGNDKEAKQIILNLQESTKKADLIEDNDILRHNVAVFETSAAGNSNKLKVFSSLLDIIPEAKQNLIIYYLRNDQVNQAYNLVKELQPVTTKDYILKAVVHCLLGQQQQDKDQDKSMNENLRKAQTFFQSIGSSTTECDTIEGRQCMASCFRLSNVFSDELIYLESIEQYMKDDDDFNWNYGVALASCQKYAQAEEVLSRVKREKYRNDQVYLSWLTRCYIMNNKPELAWNLYINIDNHLVAIYLLNFLAHEFYRMGHFYFSFKAFVFLEKFSPSLDNSKGKISSAIGVFFLLQQGKIEADKLQEVIHYLLDGPQTEEVNKCIKAFKIWGKTNGINFTDEPEPDV